MKSSKNYQSYSFDFDIIESTPSARPVYQTKYLCNLATNLTDFKKRIFLYIRFL
jgi:hypothetical protein